jgi:hypothetical integral membrane protein (TIGR02206 family)
LDNLFYPPRVTFQPFGLLHLATFLVCAGLIAACGVLGAYAWKADGRSSGPNVKRAKLLMLAWTAVVQATNLVFWALPANRDLSSSLPLHLCDLAGLLAVAALAFPQVRLLCIMLYCWGIGLSTQAFFTPVIQDGPQTFRFHIFFSSHIAIVGPAVFLLCARLYRPRLADIMPGFAVTFVYGMAMIALNQSTGWNYGYVGNTNPVNPTLIDKLGTWPLRLVWLGCIILALYAMILAPWEIAHRKSKRS